MPNHELLCWLSGILTSTPISSQSSRMSASSFIVFSRRLASSKALSIISFMCIFHCYCCCQVSSSPVTSYLIKSRHVKSHLVKITMPPSFHLVNNYFHFFSFFLHQSIDIVSKKWHIANMTRESAARRGYSHRWRTFRQTYLRKNPLCAACLRLDIVREATEIDHIVPHRGCQEKFWDKNNLQPLCKSCHSRKTMSGEKILGCDVNGLPADPNHPWNLEVANG